MVRCAVGIFVVRKMPGLYPSRRGTWLTRGPPRGVVWVRKYGEKKGHPPQIWKDEVEYYHVLSDYRLSIYHFIHNLFRILEKKVPKNLYLKKSYLRMFQDDVVAISETSGLLWVFHCLWPRNAWVWPWEQQVRCFGVLGGDKMDFEVEGPSKSILTQKMVNNEDFVGRIQNCKILMVEKTKKIRICFSPETWNDWLFVLVISLDSIPWFGIGILCYSSKGAWKSLLPNWNGLDEVSLGENVCLISLEIRPYVLKCGGH